jgi:hypothetical protein
MSYLVPVPGNELNLPLPFLHCLLDILLFASLNPACPAQWDPTFSRELPTLCSCTHSPPPQRFSSGHTMGTEQVCIT